MKIITAAAFAILVGAGSAGAQSSIDAVRSQLKAQGYTNIEIKRIGSTVKFEGYKNGNERELIYDANTWSLIKDETNLNRSPDDNTSRSAGAASNDDESGRDRDRDSRDEDDDDDDDDRDDDDDDRDEDDDDDDDDRDDDDDDRRGGKNRSD